MSERMQNFVKEWKEAGLPGDSIPFWHSQHLNLAVLALKETQFGNIFGTFKEQYISVIN